MRLVKGKVFTSRLASMFLARVFESSVSVLFFFFFSQNGQRREINLVQTESCPLVL